MIRRGPPKVETTSLPAIPPPVIRDGRHTWPSVVQYLVRYPGAVMTLDYLPLDLIDGDTWEPLIHDLAVYDVLVSSGRLHSAEHVGKRGDCVDERKAPGS